VTPLVALRLGRVSNLPTVWTNVLAGSLLAGGRPSAGTYAVLCVAASLSYVGGMYLNDAFDREHDARVRPERPIPAGDVSARSVFTIGFVLLAAGFALVPWAAARGGGDVVRASCAALALGATIVFYDVHHKQNPLSPVVMGLCRVLVYATAGYCVTAVPQRALWLGAAALLSHLIGLSYAAKQENLGRIDRAWPLACLALPLLVASAVRDAAGAALLALHAAATASAARWLLRRQGRDIPRAVSQLIAGISLLDGLLIATWGSAASGTAGTLLGLAGLGGFVLTRLFQRVVPGT
jgi:4-hydroxybenzoate polyprenyltransferase